MENYDDQDRDAFSRRGFGRAPMRGSTSDRAGYGDEGPQDGYDRRYDDRRYENARPGEQADRHRPAGGWDTPGPHRGRGPKGYTRSNDRIRDDVCERLTQHGHIDASAIDVSVDNGEVTLTGTVDSRRSKRLAEDVAETISGVRDVHNHLHIRRDAQG